MSWFGSDDVENGNSCYQGFGSSGSCYGCPHEADCPYQTTDTQSSLLASLSDMFTDDDEEYIDEPAYEDEEEDIVICPGIEDDEESGSFNDW